jgi:AraC-like DNA-binding protein
LLDILYDLFRAAAGFSLIVAGVSFLIMPGADRVHRALGPLFASVGALFCMSAVSPMLSLPVDLDNLIIVFLIYVLSSSLITLTLFLFGNEKRKGSGRRINTVGAIVSAALVILPLLDYLFGWAPVLVSVEDSRQLGPVHAIVSAAIYAWPIVACVLSFLIARWTPADVPSTSPDTRNMLVGLLAVLAALLAILASVVLRSRMLYRASHVALEAFMLAWYLYVVRHPDSFRRMRRQIGGEHARRFRLSEHEIALITEHLTALAARRDIISNDALTLPTVARRVGVPAYRLSVYFSKHLSTTFPAWRNALRMDYVKKLMAERPDLPIIQIALDAGYNSKAAFNTQFSRIMGMRPSDYRRSLARAPKGTDS